MIRKACLDDVPAMARVHVDTWRTAYQGIIPEATLASLSYEQREEGWKQILRSSGEKGLCTYIAATSTGQIVGFARGGPERTGDTTYRGELEGVYILSQFQRQGIGRCLVRTVAQQLAQAGIDSMLVWVLSNNPARKFYEVLGGQQLIREKQREMGGVMLTEIAYGWTSMNILVDSYRS